MRRRRLADGNYKRQAITISTFSPMASVVGLSVGGIMPEENTVLIYGGTKEQVEQQMVCAHKWHGPCIDEMSRYNKCLKCFVLQRDMDKEEYYKEIGLER